MRARSRHLGPEVVSRFILIAFALVLLATGCAKTAETPAQTRFDTPDAAVIAMFQAASKNDTTALLGLMGPESRAIVIGADPVQSLRERQVLVAAMIERWWLEGEGDARTLVIGNESYPMAVPLVREGGKWRFDTAAGKEELFYRRIGRNELAVIDIAAACVEAQREYAAASHDGVPKGAYARRFLSEEGKHNGLYWPTTASQATPSPMGELVAKAEAHGYSQRNEPCMGYYFKILEEQGPNAPGGQRSWVVGGAMTGGFGMLAWPAEYGTSGVMTFLVGPDGVLLQKDLGAETQVQAEAITAFDPDSTWGAP